ncbi:conserved hypothetical protein [Gloeothece citriformis PCC 7424]|uniref:Excinuclease ATPase subunit n=1 Tax=Gloeothece citriformis (strain PCC 7424) TaxID=65393 RepID=B7KKV9_GLOC7|nr:hypothetical protein [Gloeothece citriformis]ACK71078.1 conserved hypothetical protein [Gloeothece citriformis PCC 7424]
MTDQKEEILDIEQKTGLKRRHFADLIRVAQIISDPSGGVARPSLSVDWSFYGISEPVAENLSSLGQRYQYASPHIPIHVVWPQLTPETRSWFIAHKNELWQIEEAFPARDED